MMHMISWHSLIGFLSPTMITEQHAFCATTLDTLPSGLFLFTAQLPDAPMMIVSAPILSAVRMTASAGSPASIIVVTLTRFSRAFILMACVAVLPLINASSLFAEGHMAYITNSPALYLEA